jgi:hypothetical protein
MPLLDAKKIFWAVDPFANPVMLQRSAAWAIHALTRKNPASEIHPIYMAGDWPDTIVPQRFKRSYLEKMQAFAEDSMKRITRGISIENLKPIQIVSGHFDSVEQGVQFLSSTAIHQKADLVVASTRANRSGGGPFTLPGSFVESLIDISDIPLFTVNPSWRYATGIPSILFPSDLSYESHAWYLKTLDFAKMMGAKVTLFHKITFPLSQPFESAVRIFPEMRNMVHQKIKDSQVEAKRWVQAARQKHVRVSVVIDSKMAGSLSESIMETLKTHPGSVVVAPPISIAYPRSTIRKLMKRSPYPMILIPTLLRKEARAFGARKAA